MAPSSDDGLFDPGAVPAPEVSTLGHAVARRRLRAALLGEVAQPVRVDRFALTRELGHGGMGTVWLAHDEQLGRPIALKFLRRAAEGDAGEQRLHLEAQALAKLSHPNVVPVYDVGRHEGRVWLAMEFVPGRTLRAWVAQEPPRARAIVAAWLDAGRGLAAVHAAGLIHRDVKPDNVMRGDDGRVRLVDFGLVRAVGQRRGAEEAGATLADGAQISTAASSAPSTAPLTQSNHFVGTYAYAAPEQIEGGAIDARADQYSFCVSLWEALTGTRPGASGSLEPEGGEQIASLVRTALLRGLSVDRNQRFDDLEQLLDALEPRRGRWIAAAVAGSGVLMGAVGLAAGWVAAPTPPTPDPCANTARPLEERWTAEARAAVRSLDERGGPVAEAALDDFAQRWREAALQSCTEVEIEQVRSPRSLDIRRACLEAQLDRFGVLVTTFGEHTPEAIESVGPWLAALDEPQSCLLPALLDGTTEPLPDDLRPQLRHIRRELFEVRLGSDDPSLEHRQAHARTLRRQAEQLQYRRVQGEVADVQGLLAYWAAEADASREYFGEALDLGTELGDAETMANAWHGLITVALELDIDLERADWLLRREEHIVPSLGDSPRWRARALTQRGAWHLIRGERQPAEALTRQAITELEEAGPSYQWLLASALRNLANVLLADGRAKEAHPLMERARTFETFDDSNARAGRSARSDVLLNEGTAALLAGEMVEATTKLTNALDTLQRERGPLSIDVADAHVKLSSAYDARGDFESARQHARSADHILRTAHSATHPDRVFVASALGTLDFREEHFESAVAEYERALALAELQADATPSTIAVHRANLGEAYFRAGRLPQAERTLGRAVADIEAIDGRDAPHGAIPNKALGEVLLERDNAPAARRHLEHALAVLTKHGLSEVELAETRFSLARALLADGERDRALATARIASKEFSAVGPSLAHRATTVREWLANHTKRSTTNEQRKP